jgi:hypothetical protein
MARTIQPSTSPSPHDSAGRHLRVRHLPATSDAALREPAQRQQLHLARALRLVQAELLEQRAVFLGKRREGVDAVCGEERGEQLENGRGLRALERLHGGVAEDVAPEHHVLGLDERHHRRRCHLLARGVQRLARGVGFEVLQPELQDARRGGAVGVHGAVGFGEHREDVAQKRARRLGVQVPRGVVLLDVAGERIHERAQLRLLDEREDLRERR